MASRRSGDRPESGSTQTSWVGGGQVPQYVPAGASGATTVIHTQAPPSTGSTSQTGTRRQGQRLWSTLGLVGTSGVALVVEPWAAIVVAAPVGAVQRAPCGSSVTQRFAIQVLWVELMSRASTSVCPRRVLPITSVPVAPRRLMPRRLPVEVLASRTLPSLPGPRKRPLAKTLFWSVFRRNNDRVTLPGSPGCCTPVEMPGPYTS